MNRFIFYEKKNIDESKPPEITDLFDSNMNYIICSSGGCGSTMLSHYLSHFGNVFHVHDRYPPDKLCHVGHHHSDENIYKEWFNKVEISENNLKNYKVIFIYRDPLQVIFSRFVLKHGPNIPHLQNIKCVNDGKIGIMDIVNHKRDFYGLEQFFDNYVVPRKRNYKIYCVKYEQFFSKITEFNAAMGIPNIPSLFPNKSEKAKRFIFTKELTDIYFSLKLKMDALPFIHIVEPIGNPISIHLEHEHEHVLDNQI